MDLEIPDYIVELEAATRRAFADLGGVDLARRAEIEPDERAQARDALRALGAFDIDPLEDVDQALAALVFCREAGRVALPWPIEATLCRADGHSVVLVDSRAPLVEHGDVLESMLGVDLAGGAWEVTVSDGRLRSRLAPFAFPVALRPRSGDVDATAAATAAWALSAATVLGSVEGALAEATEHVRNRYQFGQRIADFQAVQFQIADAVVAVTGLAELARFTFWRVAEHGAGARTDALALRLHAADVARSALRTAQQLHGAAGVSDEYDVSVLCRRVQATLRIPVSSDRVLDVLVDTIRDGGFSSLFPQGRDRADV
jgi:hypothetical protein